MGLYRAIKTMLLGPAEMATVRLSSWTRVHDTATLAKVQHAAEYAGLFGWVMVSRAERLEAELEGPKSELEDFLANLVGGKITGRQMPVERAWGAHQNRYTQLRVRLPGMVLHKHSPGDE